MSDKIISVVSRTQEEAESPGRQNNIALPDVNGCRDSKIMFQNSLGHEKSRNSPGRDIITAIVPFGVHILPFGGMVQ